MEEDPLPKYPRLLVHVEGQTEETFVNVVLRPYLEGWGFGSVGARILGNARQRDRRGGIRGWSTVRSDITKQLLQDRECIVTTMVDYYGLPATGSRSWPGRNIVSIACKEKADSVENGMLLDMLSVLGQDVLRGRFIPYVLMHEFEGLLFSDCNAFANGMSKPGLAQPLAYIRSLFPTPEHINDSPLTAPSKRLANLFPAYEKPLFGTLAVLEIGLTRIRSECPLFDNWITRLEQLT